MPRTRVEQEPLASWRADRGLRRARTRRHEGAAPAEPVEVGSQVLGGHSLEAGHERVEERMDGVDAVDGALRTVLGIIGFMRGDLQVVQHVDVCGRLVRGADRARADAVAKDLRRTLARDNAAARDLEEGGDRVSLTPVMTQICSRERPRLWTCLPRWRVFLGRVKEPFEWLPLKGSGK